MQIAGRVWIFGDDINTDLIFPNTAFRLPVEEQVKLVFSSNRPGWVNQVQRSDIIVAGRNFGTGSSRPGAALLKRLGLGGLMADSINGLFYRNCISYGLPALQCEGVSEIFNEGDEAEIDLGKGTVKNRRTGETLKGSQLTSEVIDILATGGIEELLRKKGFIE
ncbi:MAG: 3-isopropylmalate dehydratase [Bacillota bacterium]|nr:3-isopropylmalate dehydratase [Bacillota bacterium]